MGNNCRRSFLVNSTIKWFPSLWKHPIVFPAQLQRSFSNWSSICLTSGEEKGDSVLFYFASLSLLYHVCPFIYEPIRIESNKLRKLLEKRSRVRWSRVRHGIYCPLVRLNANGSQCFHRLGKKEKEKNELFFSCCFFQVKLVRLLDCFRSIRSVLVRWCSFHRNGGSRTDRLPAIAEKTSNSQRKKYPRAISSVTKKDQVLTTHSSVSCSSMVHLCFLSPVLNAVLCFSHSLVDQSFSLLTDLDPICLASDWELKFDIFPLGSMKVNWFPLRSDSSFLSYSGTTEFSESIEPSIIAGRISETSVAFNRTMESLPSLRSSQTIS